MKDHVILLGWFVVTAAVNYLLRTRTPEEWEKLAEKNPRYAAFARALRAIGVDPVKLIQSLVDFVRGESQKRLGSSSEATCAAPEQKPAANLETKDVEADSSAKEGKDIE